MYRYIGRVCGREPKTDSAAAPTTCNETGKSNVLFNTLVCVWYYDRLVLYVIQGLMMSCKYCIIYIYVYYHRPARNISTLSERHVVVNLLKKKILKTLGINRLRLITFVVLEIKSMWTTFRKSYFRYPFFTGWSYHKLCEHFIKEFIFLTKIMNEIDSDSCWNFKLKFEIV